MQRRPRPYGSESRGGRRARDTIPGVVCPSAGLPSSREHPLVRGLFTERSGPASLMCPAGLRCALRRRGAGCRWAADLGHKILLLGWTARVEDLGVPDHEHPLHEVPV